MGQEKDCDFPRNRPPGKARKSSGSGAAAGHIGGLMPFVRDVAHDERVVERHASGWKKGGVLEVAGGHMIDDETADAPSIGLEFQPVETAWIGGHGVTKASTTEKFRRFRQRTEAGSGWPFIAVLTFDLHAETVIAGVHAERDKAVAIGDIELSQVMFTRKNATACEVI